MSYILDALKKADAERERDAAAVPDLHAQADAAAGLAARAGAGRSTLVFAGVALLLGALAWWWFAATPTSPPASAIAPPVALPATPVAGTSPIAVAPQPAAPAPAAVAMAAPTPTPTRTAVAPPTPAALPRLAPPAPAASAPRLPALAELPADIRAQMPTLVVGGSMYSPAPASRMLILGGQVFREGDKPADGLVLEQIGLKSSVLSFRGQRFELKH